MSMNIDRLSLNLGIKGT